MSEFFTAIEQHGWTVVLLVCAAVIVIDEWKRRRD